MLNTKNNINNVTTTHHELSVNVHSTQPQRVYHIIYSILRNISVHNKQLLSLSSHLHCLMYLLYIKIFLGTLISFMLT